MKCPRCGFENPDLFSFCGQCGQRISRDGVSTPIYPVTGERRLVTVLFACLPGLPALSEHLPLEDARRLINSCLESLAAPIYKYGGTLDKFVGQEIMVVFGAPETHEDDTVRALRTALEMASALKRFNETEGRHLPQPLTFGCGVNTGHVFAGEVGLAAYSVMGDAVNLANRLAHLAEPGQILVGESTYRQAHPRFDFLPLPPLRVRGRMDAMPIYLLVGGREEHVSGWPMATLTSPLVGRVEELHTLESGLARLRAGRGGVIAITGEAGLGKSRLVEEVRSRYPDLQWLEGHAFSYNNHQPLLPFQDLLWRWAGVKEQTEEEIRRQVLEVLKLLLPDSAREIYPFILNLLQVRPDPESAEVLDALSAEGVRGHTLTTLRLFFAGLARQRPTVVVLEDLQWADPSTMEMLRRLLPLTTEVPCFFILLSRQPIREALGQEPLEPGEVDWSDISLIPLSPDETITLTRNLLQGGVVPHDIQRQILEHAEGNPLFVEETLRSLIQKGILIEQNGQWRATHPLQQIEIPDTLRILLTSRVDHLPPLVKETLYQAAVIGRIFTRRLLARVTLDESLLDQHLRTLLENNLIRYYALEGEEGRAYTFSHSLIREVAYEAILMTRRLNIHRRVLAAMEEIYSGRLEEHSSALAYHACGGEMWEKAVHYLHRAGDRAKGSWALREAVHYYEQAMEIIQQHNIRLERQRLADLYHECATAHTMLGNFDAANTVWQRLMEMGNRTQDPLLRGHALQSAAVVSAHRGDISAMIENSLAACRELEAAGADWSRGVALLALAQGQAKAGQLDAAQASIAEGLRLVGDTRHWPGYDPRGEAFHNAGLVAMLKGNLEEALRYFAQAREMAARAGEQVYVGASQGFTGLVLGYRGRYDAAITHAEQGFQTAQQAESPLIAYVCKACSAWVHAMMGHYGTVLRLTDFATLNQEGFRDARVIALVAQGDAYASLQLAASALTAYQQALEVAGLTHVVTISAIRGIGMAHLGLGQTEAALNSLESAVSLAAYGGLQWFHAQALRDLARACLLLGQPNQAGQRADELLSLAIPGGYAELAGWGYLWRGLARGVREDIKRALETGVELGCLPLTWEAGEALADEPQAHQAACAAVQAIADDLPEGLRASFLNCPRVHALLAR